MSHRKVSYVHLFMGYSFVAGVAEPALVGGTPLDWEGIVNGVLGPQVGESCETALDGCAGALDGLTGVLLGP